MEVACRRLRAGRRPPPAAIAAEGGLQQPPAMEERQRRRLQGGRARWRLAHALFRGVPPHVRAHPLSLTALLHCSAGRVATRGHQWRLWGAGSATRCPAANERCGAVAGRRGGRAGMRQAGSHWHTRCSLPATWGCAGCSCTCLSACRPVSLHTQPPLKAAPRAAPLPCAPADVVAWLQATEGRLHGWCMVTLRLGSPYLPSCAPKTVLDKASARQPGCGLP